MAVAEKVFGIYEMSVSAEPFHGQADPITSALQKTRPGLLRSTPGTDGAVGR